MKLFGLLVLCAVTAVVAAAGGDLKTASKALESAQKLVHIFKSDIIPSAKVKMVADIASNVLSFATSIVNLIDGEVNKDSPEMVYMRGQFAEVHGKLNGISLQLKDMEEFNKWHDVRQRYKENEEYIRTTSLLLDLYVGASAYEREYRKRLFIDAYNERSQSALMLYNGVMRDENNYDRDLGTAAVKYTRNNRWQVMQIMVYYYRTILRGAEINIAYERLKHGENTATIAEADWKRRMTKLSERMVDIETQVIDAWAEQMKIDVLDFLRKKEGVRNSDFVAPLQNELTKKFYWRYWFVLAYAPVKGWDNNAISMCGGVVHLRTNGRSLVVASSDPKESRFNKPYIDEMLSSIKSHLRVPNAEEWLTRIKAGLRNHNNCRDAAFRGAVCYGCDVWYACPEDRVSYISHQSHNGVSVNAWVFG